ncbi:hypothetical protein HDV57DRAFT_150006 [Trichoderma longibrachiatum]|uniref:Uncharacterized protein n=1 Tax=Trichoderma longibrachiatum ATCC 18648 TaxID=983965 RepID=A0A2T4CAT9_TRILO|nr:hypothetical protein M440DRAFT_1199052 [Trichoderma longibrachiatum ATCC 18648]
MPSWAGCSRRQSRPLPSQLPSAEEGDLAYSLVATRRQKLILSRVVKYIDHLGVRAFEIKQGEKRAMNRSRGWAFRRDAMNRAAAMLVGPNRNANRSAQVTTNTMHLGRSGRRVALIDRASQIVNPFGQSAGVVPLPMRSSPFENSSRRLSLL